MKFSNLQVRIPTVSRGPRLVHFIIDCFAIELIRSAFNLIFSLELSEFINLLIFPAYYILFEYHLQSTPGKMVTNTIVINDFGAKPDLRTIILRSFIRFIPFEPLSCLGVPSRGWHDSWSQTYVVDKNVLPRLMERLGNDHSIVEQPILNKSQKNLWITVVLVLIGAGLYGIYRSFTALAFQSTEKIMMQLADKQYAEIKGAWRSDWQIFKEMDFKNRTDVVCVNQNSDTLHLHYSIETLVLVITDNKGLNMKLFINEVNDDTLILRDVVTMKENILFTRK